jgi:hypothetical protein
MQNHCMTLPQERFGLFPLGRFRRIRRLLCRLRNVRFMLLLSRRMDVSRIPSQHYHSHDEKYDYCHGKYPLPFGHLQSEQHSLTPISGRFGL